MSGLMDDLRAYFDWLSEVRAISTTGQYRTHMHTAYRAKTRRRNRRTS